ncbi:RNHCP domain-containing protein [Candidatus Peregrinibacteria bacterium CG11_big_fil_rev_8_21_14_0_20_46_8]|nr:MAG: RNHCP domain-containing protein [Candidatus Peregrinibacteria bacterium CG11_big_fil_rev_8_21_14_0_20_46_8]
MPRKDFIKHNQAFICSSCKSENPPLEGGERNHCRSCLYSLHVDAETPGDRQSSCKGRMEPARVEYKGAKGFMVVHRCVQCGKEIANRLAPDDDQTILSKLSP